VSSDSDGSNNAGAIAGGVIGAFAAIGLLAAAILRRKKSSGKMQKKLSMATITSDHTVPDEPAAMSKAPETAAPPAAETAAAPAADTAASPAAAPTAASTAPSAAPPEKLVQRAKSEPVSSTRISHRDHDPSATSPLVHHCSDLGSAPNTAPDDVRITIGDRADSTPRSQDDSAIDAAAARETKEAQEAHQRVDGQA